MDAIVTPEVRAFLLEEVHTGKVATVRPDGRPHITPIWYDLDGDTLIFTIWHTTVKFHNLQRDPRLCLCVDDERPPFHYVQIEGIASLSDEAADLRYWGTRLAGRYMGADRAEEYGKRNAVPGEWVVRVQPTRVIFNQNVAH